VENFKSTFHVLGIVCCLLCDLLIA